MPPAAFTDLGCGLTPSTSGLAALTAFVPRLLAMRFHWRAPRAWYRRSTVREE